ncbi:hypothetical protein HanPI659440_Chr12g0466011 [Helianthus annuus]|nr:hypothetical protein HanPI659440_Chr12g0466011 [Helianthus annuus]
MATIPKSADEELWYLQIVKNFALPQDEDLAAQPPTGAGELTNLGIGPEKKRRAPAANTALKKTDAVKTQLPKAKNVKGDKKGTRHSSDSWCDYVVVSDSLEGLAPVVVKKPKAEPRDSADIPASNPDDPIDLELSPEPLLMPLLRNPLRASSAVNVDLLPSPPHAPINEQLESTQAVENEAENIAEAEIPEVEKPVEVESKKILDSETADVDAAHPKSPKVVTRDPEKGKSAQEDHVTIFPTSASAPGTFPPGEIQFQEGRPHEQTYHAYLEEAATYTSTTYRMVREWRSMHKEWAAFEASKKKAAEDEARTALLRAKLEADRAKVESDQKTEEWPIASWKRKGEAEAALLSESTIVGLRQEKADAEAAHDEACSHRERSEQREVWTCTTLALRDKEIDELTALLSEQEQIKAELESAKKDSQLERVEKAETSRRLVDTEEKLESSETAWVTAESQIEPLKNDMLWLKDHRIISVANSDLNSDELDKMVAHLLVAARNDGYAQGYSECSQHVVNALKVDWDTSRSATHGSDTEAALAATKTQFNTLQLPVMDLVTVALQSEDFLTQLREVFPDMEDDDDEDLE